MVSFGADRLALDPSLLGRARRIALATNDAARSAFEPGIRTRSLLLDAGLPIARLFSPEHGLHVTAPDGAPIDDSTDTLTGLPIVSLYGGRFAPGADALRDLDAVVVDLPDVGARCYTYTWTLTHLIDACAVAGIPVWVLDRPNPLSGLLRRAEGPLLEPVYYSHIGRHDIPLRHSLTMGELALLWQRERRPDAKVNVIECEGWHRELTWADLGLPWVPTSPAMNCFQAVVLYPGLVLFEATNLSVGRGTTHAFRTVGAPWFDPAAVQAQLHERLLRGVRIEATSFTPRSGPYAGERCEGLAFHVTDVDALHPAALGIALLADIAMTHRDQFAWAAYPTAANPTGAGHLERLVGNGEVRVCVERAMRTREALGSHQIARLTAAPRWGEAWEAVQLYPGED